MPRAWDEDRGKSLSETVPVTVEWARDVERRPRPLREFFAQQVQEGEAWAKAGVKSRSGSP